MEELKTYILNAQEESEEWKADMKLNIRKLNRDFALVLLDKAKPSQVVFVVLLLEPTHF